MPKGKLEFDLPMEQQEFQDAIDGAAWKSAMEDFFWNSLKQKEDAEGGKAITVAEAAEWCRQELLKVMEEHGVELP